MSNNLSPHFVEPESLRRKHESGNPPIKAILLVALAVALTVLISLGIIWVMIGSFAQKRSMKTQAGGDLGLITAPGLQPLQRFSTPNLQLVPHDDLVALSARAEQELNSYGWIDRRTGIVRLPISRAMDLIHQRGFPEGTNAIAPPGKSTLELIQERSQTR